MEAEDYAKRAERVKALLSSYYGAGEAGPAGQPGAAHKAGEDAGSGSSSQPSLATKSIHDALPAMDSPAYNVDQHTARMLKTLPLEKLMVEHRGMAREIKNLDSDMQQLVYENYNKFISATDTIRTMKSNMDGMNTDMEKLKTITGAVPGPGSRASITASIVRCSAGCLGLGSKPSRISGMHASGVPAGMPVQQRVGLGLRGLGL